MIGSGNWGSAVAKLVAENAQANPRFDTNVRMWVFQEQVEGRNLTDIINSDHENVKYLPGVKLPENLVAIPDLKTACEGADALVFNLPHQFLQKVCEDVKDTLSPKAFGVTCIK